MSTTRVMTVLKPPPTAITSTSSSPSCPSCGTDISHTHPSIPPSAQKRIEELEAEVKILTLRATAAVERATDYEDALRRFASTTSSPLPQILTSPPQTASYPPLPPTTATTPYTPQTAHAPPNSRLSRLLPTRRSINQPPPSTAPLHPTPYTPGLVYPATAGLPQPSAETTELLTALTREQTLRLAAESAVSQTNEEIEELTGQLFQQANEMVASERRERAKLEERVVVLEKRDGEKTKRLEVLEGRLGRIERVRGLLRRDSPALGEEGVMTGERLGNGEKSGVVDGGIKTGGR